MSRRTLVWGVVIPVAAALLAVTPTVKARAQKDARAAVAGKQEETRYISGVITRIRPAAKGGDMTYLGTVYLDASADSSSGDTKVGVQVTTETKITIVGKVKASFADLHVGMRVVLPDPAPFGPRTLIYPRMISATELTAYGSASGEQKLAAPWPGGCWASRRFARPSRSNDPYRSAVTTTVCGAVRSRQ